MTRARTNCAERSVLLAPPLIVPFHEDRLRLIVHASAEM